MHGLLNALLLLFLKYICSALKIKKRQIRGRDRIIPEHGLRLNAGRGLPHATTDCFNTSLIKREMRLFLVPTKNPLFKELVTTVFLIKNM